MSRVAELFFWVVHDSSAFQLVFDAANQSYQTWRHALLPGGIFLVSAVTAVLFHRSKAGDTKGTGSYFYILSAVATFTGFACSVVVWKTWSEYRLLRDSLQTGQYRLIVGRVIAFSPEQADGHPIERFRVGNVEFAYSSSDITSGFHRTAVTGGPIREGLLVRIAEVKGLIARLEVDPSA